MRPRWYNSRLDSMASPPNTALWPGSNDGTQGHRRGLCPPGVWGDRFCVCWWARGDKLCMEQGQWWPQIRHSICFYLSVTYTGVPLVSSHLTTSLAWCAIELDSGRQVGLAWLTAFSFFPSLSPRAFLSCAEIVCLASSDFHGPPLL